MSKLLLALTLSICVAQEHVTRKEVTKPRAYGLTAPTRWAKSLADHTNETLRKLNRKYGIPDELVACQPKKPFEICVTQCSERRNEGLTSFAELSKGGHCEKMSIIAPDCQTAKCTLTHELTHYVLAHLFVPTAYPPRWLDEGLAMREDPNRKDSDAFRMHLCTEFRAGKNRYPFHALIAVSDYPEDARPIYGGWSYATEFLIEIIRSLHPEGEPAPELRLVNFAKEAEKGGWDPAIEKHLVPYKTLRAIDEAFVLYVAKNCPHKNTPD